MSDKPENQNEEVEVSQDERLEQIDEEYRKHKEAIGTVDIEMGKLKNSQRVVMKHQKEKVDKILEAFFLETGDAGTLEKIFQADMVSPKTRQMEDTLNKLVAKQLWHRRQTQKLSTEKTQIYKDLQEAEKDRLCQVIKKQFKAVADAVLGAQDVYAPLQADVQALKTMCDYDKGGYPQRLVNNDTEPWVVTLIDSYMPKCKSSDVFEFLFWCSDCPTQGNVFHKPNLTKRMFGERQA